MLDRDTQTDYVTVGKRTLKRGGFAAQQRAGSGPIRLSEYIQKNPPGILEKPKNPHSEAYADCSICGGYGWKLSDRYERWFICSCVSRNWRDKNEPEIDYAHFGLHESEVNLTWDVIDPEISDGVKGLNAVQPLYRQGWGFSLLWGTYGQAKTLLGKILVATALREGKSAMFTNMNQALDDIKLAFDDQHMNTELIRRMDKWINLDVLFIDELDKASSSEWAKQRIFQLLDQRYARALREEAVTVVASNSYSETFDGYLKSRLKDSRLGPMVHLNGMDGRLSMPKGWKH